MNESWQYTRQGLPSETLEKVTSEIPIPTSDEVIVQIKALSINPVDYKLATFPNFVRKGLGAGAYGTPRVPCFDFAGIVHAVGNSGEWKVDDEVFGRITKPSDPGSMQKYVAISSSAVMTRKPQNLSWEQAAAIPLVYVTVYGCLVDVGHLPFRVPESDKGKNSVLILGGSGGAGSQAIQLAKMTGLNVVASCSKASEEMVKKLGADEVIDYRSKNVGDVAKVSKYAPFAVVLDCVGGTEVIPYMDELLLEDPKRPELGVYVSISGDIPPGEPLQIGSALRHVGRQTLRQIRGSLNPYIPAWIPFRPYLANKRYLFYQSKPTKEMMETVPAFMEHAKEVLVDQVFDFEQSREAFAKLESGRAKGKIVVQIE